MKQMGKNRQIFHVKEFKVIYVDTYINFKKMKYDPLHL